MPVTDDRQLAETAERLREWVLAGDPRAAERWAWLARAEPRLLTARQWAEEVHAVLLRLPAPTPPSRRELDRLVAEAAGYVAEDAPGRAEPPRRISEAAVRSLKEYARGCGELDGTELSERLTAAFPAQRKAALLGKAMRVADSVAARALARAGYPVAVADAAAVRTLTRLGLLDSEILPRDRAQTYQAAIERIANRAQMTVVAADYLVHALAQRSPGGPDIEPLCIARPKCAPCPVKTLCTCFRLAPRPDTSAPYLPITDWSKDQRPRERLLAGEQMGDAELLAIILRTGTARRSAVDVAQQLLKQHGGLRGIRQRAPAELAKTPGIGLAKAAMILAALEAGRRSYDPGKDDRTALTRISRSEHIFQRFRSRFMDAPQEQFFMLTLNVKNAITDEICISQGTLSASLVHPRDVFREAIIRSAASVIFVHNHPSGDPSPSDDDRKLTAQLEKAGRLMGIRVLDHVIVGAQEAYSFRDHGDLT